MTRYICLCITSGCGKSNEDGNPRSWAESTCKRHIENDAAELKRRRGVDSTYQPGTILEREAFSRSSVRGLQVAPVVESTTQESNEPISSSPEQEMADSPRSHSEPKDDMDLDEIAERSPTEAYFQTNDDDGDQDPGEGGGDAESTSEDEGSVEKDGSKSSDDERDPINRVLAPSPVSSLASDTPAARFSDTESGPATSDDDDDEPTAPLPPFQPTSAPDNDDRNDDDSMHDDFRPSCLLELKHSQTYIEPSEETKPTEPPTPLDLTEHEIESLRHCWISHRCRDTVKSFKAHGGHKSDLGKYPEGKLLSMKRCERLLEEISGLRAQGVDACKEGCQAFTGPYKDDDRCHQLRPQTVLLPDGTLAKDKNGDLKRSPQPCESRRFKLDGKTPEWQAIYFDFIPFVSALFRNKETNEMMRYFLHELRQVFDKYGADFTDPDRPLDDVPHGSKATEHFFFFSEDDFGRRTAFSITFDGAQTKRHSKDSIWVWALQIYNIPPDKGRYQLRYFYPVLFSYGHVQPRSLDSYSRIIYERVFDAHSGFWMWDGLLEEYFVWKAKMMASLADLQAQKHDAGGNWATGRVGCPNCSQISVSKASGHGCYYCRGGGVYYTKEVERTGGRTTIVNRSQPHSGYGKLSPGKPAPMITNETYFRQLDTLDNAPEDRRSELYTAFGISHIPLIASLPDYDRATMHPPDYAHLLASNCTVSITKLWIKMDETGEVFRKVKELYRSTRRNWPSDALGRFPRDPHDAHSSNPKLYEMDRWISLFSLPCLKEAGFDKKYLDHWSLFVQLYKIVSRPGERTLEDAMTVNRLAEEFNQGLEEIYVEFDLDNVGHFPLCFHRLLHLGPWMVILGNLLHYSQLPLERYLQVPKAAGEACPRSPYPAMYHEMLIDARFMICRLLHPEAFKRIMATLDDFADPPPIQPFVLSSQLSTRAVENNSSWLAHYGALADFVKAKKLTSSLPPYTSTIRYYPTFGQVSLPGGVKLSSKMREDKLKNADSHVESWFITQRPYDTGLGTQEVAVTLGRSIALYSLPFADKSLSSSQVFATALLYGPMEAEYNGGIVSVAKSKGTVAVIAVEEVEEVVGVMESLDGTRFYLMRKGYMPKDFEGDEDEPESDR